MRQETRIIFTPEERELACETIEFLAEIEEYLEIDFDDEIPSILLEIYSKGEFTRED